MLLFWATDVKLVFIEQQGFVLTHIIFPSASLPLYNYSGFVLYGAALNYLIIYFQ